MPKSLSGDLRERVIEEVQAGTSRREAAERFEISASAAVDGCSVGAIMACVTDPGPDGGPARAQGCATCGESTFFKARTNG
jgi:hypothetical protein